MEGRLRHLRGSRLLLALVLIVLVAVAGWRFTGGGGAVDTGVTVSLVPRALYYDPLWRAYPNETLVDLVVEELGKAGYVVDVRLGPDAGVLEMDMLDAYSVVIIRSHGAYSNGTLGPRGPYIYTGLLVDEAVERVGGRVTLMLSRGLASLAVIPPGGPLAPVSGEELEGLPRYLALGPRYFEETPYYFNDTVILVGTCYSMGDEELDPVLGEILLSKGAAGYAGFQGLVSWGTVDEAIARFVKALGSGVPPGEALASLEDMPPDPVTGNRIHVLLGG